MSVYLKKKHVNSITCYYDIDCWDCIEFFDKNQRIKAKRSLRRAEKQNLKKMYL